MKEKITIKEFIEKSNGVQNTAYKPNAVEEYIRNTLEIKTYVPFVEKREMCATVLAGACKNVGSIVEVDSVSRYLLFTIAIISKYTNLTFENTDDLDAIDQYDMLCKAGFLNDILNVIGNEYEVCNNILNMMMADIDANNNNVAAVFDKALQEILSYVGNFADVLADKVENLELDLSQIDIDKIMGVIDKLPKK